MDMDKEPEATKTAVRSKSEVAEQLVTQLNILQYQVLNNVDVIFKGNLGERQLDLLVKKPMVIALRKIRQLSEELNQAP